MTKRGHGEGSVYRRRDGKWAGALSLGYDGSTGKPLRKYVYGATQGEALEKLAELKRTVAKGLPITPGRMTVAQLLTQWLTDRVAGRVRASTYRDYESIVRVHLIPALGRHRVKSLTPQHVQAMLNTKATALSARRVQYIRTVLRMALKHGQRWGYVGQNVASLTDIAPAKKRRVDALTAPQAAELLKAVESHRERHLFVVALATGLRQAEILGLRWPDVDLEAGTLRVRETLQRLDGAYVLLPPKTEESDRTIALPAIALEAMKARRVEQLEQRLAAGPLWRDVWGLVFTTPFGKPLHGETLTRNFQAALVAAGIPRQRFHDLRHGAATLMLGTGTELKVVQKILGHSTIVTTGDVYAGVIDELHRTAAANMDRALRGGT